MVRYFLIICSLLSSALYSQESIVTNNFVTIKQGITIGLNNAQDVSLHIGAEYFNTPKLSLIGEGNIFLEASKKDKKELSYSHALFSGANYHFINEELDFYFGFQPGVNFSKRISTDTFTSQSIVSPLVSISTGFNYYSKYYFHFYTQLRYVYGSHLEDTQTKLSGIRLTFGLGYNLSQIFKSYKK